MKYRRLAGLNCEVSIVSLGASSFGSVFRETDEEESIKVVHRAIEAGINYIDTAPWYGHGKSETVLGKALKDIPRDKYILATKIGRYLPEVDKMIDFSAERTIRSVDESLQRLGVDYVDVIQVHDMEFAPNLDIIIQETLPALQKVKESGKAKYIGITGYPLSNFREVIERSTVQIDTVLTYCRYSMNDSALTEYLPFFKEHSVGVINASPISMGLLSNRGAPDWHPATSKIKDICSQAAKYCKDKGVDISKLAMYYTLKNEDIPTTLVSTASLVNLEKNIASANLELSQLELDTLQVVMDKFMTPNGNMSWEGIEVAEYWENIRKLKSDP